MDNLEFWNKYKSVPENALKDFDNGNFKGTDINTIWRMKCLTETFGMCGIGWYYNIVRTWNERLEEAQTELTFAEIELYIKVDGEWSKPIAGVGGNKMLSYVNSKGYYKASDEAIKMAVTDAIGNACRNLGIGADIYWQNDKTKYTENEEHKKPVKVEKKPLPEKLEEVEINCGDELETAQNYVINFGKYKGQTLQSIDSDYLRWLVDNATTEIVRKYSQIILNWENDVIANEPVSDDELPF